MKTIVMEIESGDTLFEYDGDISLDHQNGIVEVNGNNYRFFYNKIVIDNGDVTKIINVSKFTAPE